MRRVVIAFTALTMLVACGTNQQPTVTTSTSTAPTTTTTSNVVDGVALKQVATLNQPIAFAMRTGDDAFFIAEKGGTIRRLQTDGTSQLVLDIHNSVSTGTEQGLLDITFSPDGSKLYVDFTNSAGDTRVVEYGYADGRADAGRPRVVLAVDQPSDNHNGGSVVFGPDGLLYVGMGDGGDEGDPQGRAQNSGSLLGKLLRIDPNSSDPQPEIWAKGLRNPWRFTFDRSNGDLWIADVGQDAWEEVDHVTGNPGGLNYGWNKREATHAYNGAAAPAGAVDPVYEYNHAGGNCSITGGFVYRGTAIRGLAGNFVFADYCKGRLFATAGGGARDLGVDVAAPISFGQDADGELLVLSQRGGVYRLVRA